MTESNMSTLVSNVSDSAELANAIGVVSALEIDWNGAQVSLKNDLEPRTINTTGDLLKAVQDASNVGGAAADNDTKNTVGNQGMNSTQLYLVGTVSQGSKEGDFGISYTNEGVYIGSDNSLYSNGKKVALEEVATTTAAGLMTDVDKIKLDGIAANANNYTLPAATNRTLGGIRTNYID